SLNLRPRRAADHGPWSGLRVTVEVDEIPNDVHTKRGVYIIITDPSNHPFESGLFVPVNSLGDIAVWGDAIRPTERVAELPRHKRSCLFAGDEKKLSRGYLRENCNVQCIQDAMLSICGCVPHFVFYILQEDKARLPACNLEGLLCLSQNHDHLNNFLASSKAQPKSGPRSSESGIHCECQDNCASQNYIAKLGISKDAQSPSQVVLDIHYENPHCILYETDIIFGFLDALG
ncbi:hypothetical protein WDU94_002480, partial [Cyamophila willieti]